MGPLALQYTCILPMGYHASMAPVGPVCPSPYLPCSSAGHAGGSWVSGSPGSLCLFGCWWVGRRALGAAVALGPCVAISSDGLLSPGAPGSLGGAP